MAPGGSEPRWVSRLAVDAIHFDLLATHGGMPGLRDEDALVGALTRPRHRHAYEAGSDIATLAASYGFGIARNHPFNDGNKRVAFVVMAVFAGLNGFDIVAPETEVVTFMLDLAAGSLTEERLAEWFRSRLVASPDGTPG